MTKSELAEKVAKLYNASGLLGLDKDATYAELGGIDGIKSILAEAGISLKDRKAMSDFVKQNNPAIWNKLIAEPMMWKPVEVK